MLVNKAVKQKAISCIRNFRARDCTKTGNYIHWGGKVCFNGAIAKCFGATVLDNYHGISVSKSMEIISNEARRVEHSQNIIVTMMDYFGIDVLEELDKIHTYYANGHITFVNAQKQIIKLIKELPETEQ